MPVYTVHAPLAVDSDIRTADKFVFVRDGYYFWAFLFGPFWLAWRRLWLALLGYILVMIVAAIGLWAIDASAGMRFAVMLVIALLMGFEAASLRRGTLSRRKWRQLDIVVADGEDSAERRFFDRWAAKQLGSSNDHLAVDRGAPPPTRATPGQPFSRPASHHDVIGLFPQPGGSR